MKIEYLPFNRAKLTSPTGIIDIRNGEWFSEAVVQRKNVRYFKAATRV